MKNSTGCGLVIEIGIEKMPPGPASCITGVRDTYAGFYFSSNMNGKYYFAVAFFLLKSICNFFYTSLYNFVIPSYNIFIQKSLFITQNNEHRSLNILQHAFSPLLFSYLTGITFAFSVPAFVQTVKKSDKIKSDTFFLICSQKIYLKIFKFLFLYVLHFGEILQNLYKEMPQTDF